MCACEQYLDRWFSSQAEVCPSSESSSVNDTWSSLTHTHTHKRQAIQSQFYPNLPQSPLLGSIRSSSSFTPLPLLHCLRPVYPLATFTACSQANRFPRRQSPGGGSNGWGTREGGGGVGPGGAGDYWNTVSKQLLTVCGNCVPSHGLFGRNYGCNARHP